MFLFVVVAVCAVVMGFYALYVALIKKKNKLQEAYYDIDVQLKKRYDLLPNILNIASKFMVHEQELLQKIVELRTQTMTTELQTRFKMENELDSYLKNLWLNVENYPDLKSNQTMLQAMQTFNEVEEHISAARRFYNAAVADLKNAVEIFPSCVIARAIGVKVDKPFFKAEEQEKRPINVKDYFKS